MAIQLGGTSSMQSEINVTPLVDVVLVLLIIFMVVTPVLQMGLDVEIPPKVEVTTPPPQGQEAQLVVTVRTGGIFLNREPMGSIEQLRNTLASILVSREPDKRIVFLSAEDGVPFQQAVATLDVAREAGAQKIGFLTDPPRE